MGPPTKDPLCEAGLLALHCILRSPSFQIKKTAEIIYPGLTIHISVLLELTDSKMKPQVWSNHRL